MNRGTVVLLGNFSTGRLSLDPLVEEFGWSVESAFNVDSLWDVGSECKVVAVLIGIEELGLSWQQALGSVHPAVPGALAIACRRFSDSTPWVDLAAAGAFYQLRLPFDRDEIRQALGFVWAAQNRSRKTRRGRVLPMQRRRLAS